MIKKKAMRHYSIFFLNFILLFTVTKSLSQDQSAIFYKNAANAYRTAANNTKCPERAAYLRKLADWNTCMVDAHAGGGSCGLAPNGNTPPCAGDMIGGGSGNVISTSTTSSDPLKELQLSQQQTQLELDRARNTAENTYQNAITAGKKDSGAMLDATLAATSQISDPTGQAVYTGVGLGMSLLMHLGEKKEAERAEIQISTQKEIAQQNAQRLEKLNNMKRSLSTSSSVFNFIESETSYHITNLKIGIKHGMVKSIVRKDLYDIDVKITDVKNTQDSICFLEIVKYKNLTSSADSCIVNKISIPFKNIIEAGMYNGDIANAFDPKSNVDQKFRHIDMTNEDIKSAFTLSTYNEGNYIGKISSGLYDIKLSTSGNNIKIQQKYFSSLPSQLKMSDFKNTNIFLTNHYSLVFPVVNYKGDKISLYNFIEYLNFLKN